MILINEGCLIVCIGGLMLFAPITPIIPSLIALCGGVMVFIGVVSIAKGN